MASLGRRSTVVWGFPGTTVGTAPAANIVDDARDAKIAPSSPKTRTAPKRVIFLAKSLKKPSIDDREAAKSAKRRAPPTTTHELLARWHWNFHTWLEHMCSAANATGNAARAFMGAIRGTFWRAPKMSLKTFFTRAPLTVEIIKL